jgi:serine/threonine-protein kinase ATR
MCSNQYAMESYIRTVRNGHKHVLQALPKLLTIWFSISALPEQLRASSAPPAKNHLDRVLAHIGGRMLSAKEDVPASTWYLAMPQLVSRVSHPHQDAIKLICDIVTKVMVAHSQQASFLNTSE